MESVRIKYFVEWQALAGNWVKSAISFDRLYEAIAHADDLARLTRIIEVKTITTERYMTLEFAKNERIK